MSVFYNLINLTIAETSLYQSLNNVWPSCHYALDAESSFFFLLDSSLGKGELRTPFIWVRWVFKACSTF
jgi:hypothetical protein